MGVIGVHWPSGVDSGEYRTHSALFEDIHRAGGDPAHWVVLHTRIAPSMGGYIGPVQHAKRRNLPGAEPPEPLRVGELDTVPYGDPDPIRRRWFPSVTDVPYVTPRDADLDNRRPWRHAGAHDG